MAKDMPRLAPDHVGMRVSYSGLLMQSRGALTGGERAPGLADMLRQLQQHLAELGKRWYAGEAEAVDEFLQLYCIEDRARAALREAKQRDEHQSPSRDEPLQPHIKALHFRKLDTGEHYVCSTPWRSDYWINMNPTSGSFVASFLDPARTPWHGEYPTLDAAQLACQQHHAGQVMRLIDSQEEARNG